MAIVGIGQNGIPRALQKLPKNPNQGTEGAERDKAALTEGTPASRQKAVRDQVRKYSEGTLKKLREQLESNKRQEEIQKENTESHLKCMKIASRLMAGDEVPTRDIQFLMKKDVELYARSISLRIKKAKPKKHKALTKPKEGENQQTDATKDNQSSNIGDGGNVSGGGSEGGGSDAGGGSDGGTSSEGGSAPEGETIEL